MALPDRLQKLAAEVANTGRWGPEDQRGTLNLVDAAAVLRAAAAVRQGKVFSLAIPFDEDGPQTGALPGRTNPRREMTLVNAALSGDPDGFCTSDDRVDMGVQAATHWDALAHVSYGGRMYNNTPADVVTDHGAERLGIEAFGPVVTRAVLVDIARLHGVDYFDHGHAITGDDLEAAVEATGCAIHPGDALLVRTGQMHHLRAGDRQRFANPSPGLSTQSIAWLRAHDVAAVATDTLPLEVWPPEDPDVFLPVHMIHLVDMGLAQGQLWDLDALAEDCASDGQYDMLLAATPLPLTGSPGGAVAPTAVK